jgi:hypothetical protein
MICSDLSIWGATSGQLAAIDTSVMGELDVRLNFEEEPKAPDGEILNFCCYAAYNSVTLIDGNGTAHTKYDRTPFTINQSINQY